MLNVVRSAVITSSRRTRQCFGESQMLERISCNRNASTLDTTRDEASSLLTAAAPSAGPPESSPTQLSKPKAGKLDRSKVPVVKESELEEKFISGWGPGGQKVNKAVNCCQLRHKPTGIVVKVHQSRSLEQNRKIARELLALKLDTLYNGDESVESQAKRLALHKISSRDSQSQKRRAMKEQYRRSLEAEEEAND